MPVDDANARTVIRALLDASGGRVGEFVPIADVLNRSGLGASETLHQLASRRWVQVRGDHVAATKWAIEFAMDWSNVAMLLRAILNSAGDIGKPADLEVVITASGFERREVQKLLSELSMLDLAHGVTEESRRHGVYITAKGWEYLTSGSYRNRLDPSEQLSASDGV